MKTQEQIAAHLMKVQHEDFFGFEFGDLFAQLDFEHARPFFKAGVTKESFEAAHERDAHNIPKTDEGIRAQIVEYLKFAWDKANNERGLSAMRSMAHFSAWLWLIGEDELWAKIQEDPGYYGKSSLRAISEKFGVNWRELDNDRWSHNEGGPYVTADEVPPL